MDLDNFITLVEIPPGSRRFVLGPFERGITLLKQQTRAINLIYALHEKRILKSGDTLAVIGGGIAGITAAAAGATLGYKVYLLERGHSLVHLQNGCDTRWLHPHIYEWPDAGADRLYAELPVLNWRASSASNVAKQILQQFNELKRSTTRISVFLGATVGAIDGMRMEWSSTLPLENYEQEFNALIFAVGFGIERRVNSQRQSYWRNDSYHQSAPPQMTLP